MNELDASRHSAWHLFEDRTDEEIAEFTGLPIGVVVSAMQNLLGQERYLLRKVALRSDFIRIFYNYTSDFRNLDVEFHNWLCKKHKEDWDRIGNFTQLDLLEFLSEPEYFEFFGGKVLQIKNFFTMNPLLLNFLSDALALDIVFLKSSKGEAIKLKYFKAIVEKLNCGLGVGEAIVDTKYWEQGGRTCQQKHHL